MRYAPLDAGTEALLERCLFVAVGIDSSLLPTTELDKIPNRKSATMSTMLRFGRKMRLPSTIEIKHDLTMMATADALAAALKGQECSAIDFAEIMKELNIKYHVSRDRANMLLSRFGPGRSEVMEAAKSLNERKVQYNFRNTRPKDFA